MAIAKDRIEGHMGKVDNMPTCTFDNLLWTLSATSLGG